MSVVVDPVHVMQRAFRALLAALAHPGRVGAIEEAVDAPPELGSALAASVLTLIDRDIAVWIDPAKRAAGEWLVAQTECRLVEEPDVAHFALVLDPAQALPLSRWNSGTPEDPENSATLLVRVDSVTGGTAVAIFGPGIERDAPLTLRGLPAGFWAEWKANADRYPLGVDCLFFDERNVVGLPRTARIVGQ